MKLLIPIVVVGSVFYIFSGRYKARPNDPNYIKGKEDRPKNVMADSTIKIDTFTRDTIKRKKHR